MATAQVYISRFYCSVEIRTTNPYLVVATALYLACKIEECPQHIRLIVAEARALWGDFVGNDTSKLGECEFSLISELRSQLIIHQPYRTLQGIQTDLSMQNEDISLAWSVINDHYMTDLPLLYPPHVIAHTAVLLALVLRPNSAAGMQPNQASSSAASVVAANAAKIPAALAMAQGRSQGGSTMPGGNAPAGSPTTAKGDMDRIGRVQRYTSWLAEGNVDIASMVDCAQELISFYECHEQYKDKDTREQINRFVKARGLDK
jgi:cyclin-C